jgi:ABC-type phosphate/phosphonate transport system substrate-binding protein/rhodanese-related sulfurtransferase
MKAATFAHGIYCTTLVAIVAIAATWAPAGMAAPIMRVSSEAKDSDRKWDLLDSSIPLAQHLAQAAGIPIRAHITHDLKSELVASRNPAGFMMMGPAHVIGSALRHGYEPVAQTTGNVQAAIVALKSSGIDTLAKARGKRLNLPAEDSLATYMVLAKFNAEGISLKKHFKSVRYGRIHGASLFALTMGSADLAVADLEVAKKFVESGDAMIIETTKPVPALGIVINPQVAADTKEKVRRALLDAKPGVIKAAGIEKYQFTKINKENYAEVAKMGYFTPELLAGANVLTAEGVIDMMSKGAKYYDVRTESEFKAGRVKSASLLPYIEKSKKEIDFDPTLDDFKLVETVKDKDTPIIFACNGGECWKSYKASKIAVAAGYKAVYWFRGGLPEWREKNLPIER